MRTIGIMVARTKKEVDVLKISFTVFLREKNVVVSTIIKTVVVAKTKLKLLEEIVEFSSFLR